MTPRRITCTMSTPQTASFVKLVAHPGQRDDLLAALRAMFPVVATEDGTVIYSLHIDRNDDNAVWLYELYTDDDALATHSGSEAMATLLGSLAGLVAEPPIMAFTTPTDAKGFDV
jgi:quinol monooxygenase YgiN